jgi:hypothetical protein
MVWSEVQVNREQPLPDKRKGHTATLINGSTMLVFGGLGWVEDPEADNSWGQTTKHINDAWKIDLSGADGLTWHAVHTAGDAPSGREYHSSALLSGRYLVVQGGYGHLTNFLNDTHVLDTWADPMVWTRPVLSGAPPRSRHGSAFIDIGDNEILLFGGMGDAGTEDDVHILVLGTGNEQYFGL